MLNPITGSIYLVSDLDTVVASKGIPQTFVISLTEQTEYAMMIPEAMAGTVFLPPYESMMFLSDGDFNNFRDSYLAYLTSSEIVDQFLTIMVTSSVMKGTNLIIYVPMEELDLGFFGVFAEYVMNCFGIIIGSNQNPFMYNVTFDATNLQRMYMADFIDLKSLMENYPPITLFDHPAIEKIAVEMNLYIQMEESCIPQWIYQYKERIKQNNNKFLQRGVIIDASIRKGKMF